MGRDEPLYTLVVAGWQLSNRKARTSSHESAPRTRRAIFAKKSLDARRLVFLVGSFSLGFCLLGLTLHPVHAPATSIVAQNFSFNPQNVTLQTGAAETWSNNDPVIYTLWFTFATNGSTYLMSPPINPGTTWTHTFPTSVALVYYDFDRLYVMGRLSIVPVLLTDFTPAYLNNLTVTFVPAVSGGTMPYKYSWTLGDGTTSNSVSPAHTYSSGGTYTVTLTVVDSSAPSSFKSVISHFLILSSGITRGSGGGGGSRLLNS